MFSFEESKTGPFSFDIYDNIKLLESVGLVETDINEDINETNKFEVESHLVTPGKSGIMSEKYYVTEKGKSVVDSLTKDIDEKEKESIEEVCKKYNKRSLHNLLDYVYNKYPEFTVKEM